MYAIRHGGKAEVAVFSECSNYNTPIMPEGNLLYDIEFESIFMLLRDPDQEGKFKIWNTDFNLKKNLTIY